MARIRVVLDTNLFIAAHWNRAAASAKIIGACLNGNLEAYYTDEMNRELDFILGNIHARSEFVEMVQKFRSAATRLYDVPPAEKKTVDAEDQKFIDCAVAAGADYLITSDDHLLSLHDIRRTLVVKPSTFWREVGCKLGSSSRE